MTDKEREMYESYRLRRGLNFKVYPRKVTNADELQRLIGSVNAEIMKPNAIPVRATVLCGGVLELDLLEPEDAA